MGPRYAAACLFALLAAAAVPAFSQNASMDLYDPGTLASLGSGAAAGALGGIPGLPGASVFSLAVSPGASALNPAAAGWLERITIDASYLGLAGLGPSTGWGNLANLGASFPTPYGVITASGRYLGSTFPTLNVGSMGSFNLSFAKDVYRDLSVGAGLGFQIGQDWGLGLDLGFVHAPGDLGFLRNFRWGAAIRGIGKGYNTTSITDGEGTVPPWFTPDIGTSFDLVSTVPFSLSVASDLSFPAFSDVRFALGLGIGILNTVSVQASYAFDLNDTLAGTANSFPFGFGLFATIPIQGAGDMAVTSAGAPLSGGVWGFGLGTTFSLGKIDRSAPAITLASTEDAYISPGTQSADQMLSVPLTITDSRYLKGYRLIIYDSTSKVVRTIETVDQGPTSSGIRNFFDRLFSAKKSIPVPQALTWDGKDDSGQQVPDGTYTYAVEAWDDNGNQARIDPKVIVKTVPPQVSVSAPYLEFSPTGEGTRGSLTIEQSGTSEDLWVGTIYDSSGNEVRQFRWTNEPPQTFTWQGKDTNGKLLPDGTYTYKITSTDRAGNTGTATLEGIVINTQATPIDLTTDLPAFSPGGQSPKQVIHLIPTVKVKDGIDHWSLVVTDLAGSVKRTYTGTTLAPETIAFDGKDNEGTVLPEGMYRATLNVNYRNGHNPTLDSPDFLLRVTPPSATVKAQYLEFSPDGVGTQTKLPLEQNGSTEILWQGSMADSTGNTVRSYQWNESAPKSFSWDGRDDNGKLVPDGAYTYQLTSTDPAGNTGGAEVAGIVVNTVPTPVSLAVDYSAFSPTGNSSKNMLTFSLTAPVSRGMTRWTLAVRDRTGKTRRNFSGTSPLPATQVFDGKDDDGVVLPEGPYSATLAVVYANGHAPSGDSPQFVIDVTQPTATVSSDYAVFSPIGQGTRNLVTFTQSATKDAAWTGVVKDAKGTPVRTASWKGRPDVKFVFDGHGDDGKLLPDGKYTYTLAGIDNAGNIGGAPPLALEIDTTATPAIVSTDLTAFSPNGDGVKDTIKIIPSLKVTTGIDSWELRVKDSKSTVIRRVSGTNSAPGEFTWDGLDDSKIKAPDGTYTSELEVLYRNGNRPIARTNPFVIDTHYPAITVTADTLLFAPTPDSAVQSITIHQDSSVEDQWTGQIQDSSGKPVRAFSWKGKAADLSWDGTDDNGNIMADGVYQYVVTSTTLAGSKTEKTLTGLTIDTRPTPISIQAASEGLSPNGNGIRDTIGLNLSVGLADGIKSWKLSMVEASKGVQKTFNGLPPVPASIVWDGKTDRGTVVEGTYTAQFEVRYSKGSHPTASSQSFLLSVSPPKIDLQAAPLPFSPDGDGSNDTITLTLNVTDPSPVDSWDITVNDPEGHFFSDFSGKGAPTPITWDGMSSNGELVQAASDYTMKVTVRDALGNVGTLTQTLPVDVLVFREGDKLRVRVSSIIFKADTADYVNVPADQAQKNMQTLARLAQIFQKYGQYKIRIEGHAVMVNWDKPEAGKKEQDAVLIPLSKARAEAVKAALVKLGIDASRMTTDGLGGAVPIVPFSDLENRWKDRRVEFILVR
jgi:flagellar hook assembly protein FlgD